MSDRDVAFVNALGMNYSQVARAVDTSRQVVSKKIADGRGDFFTAPVLQKLYDHKRKEDNPSCALVNRAIALYFSDLASLVIGQDTEGLAQESNFDDGEYWFVCADFPRFKANYQTCFQSLLYTAESDKATLAIIFPDKDSKQVQKFKNEYDIRRVRAIACKAADFPFQIPLLSRRTVSGGAEIFVPGAGGFRKALDFDAANLRGMMQRLFDENEMVGEVETQ
jgi:hypothetical protein